jgi:hypothetical protein
MYPSMGARCFKKIKQFLKEGEVLWSVCCCEWNAVFVYYKTIEQVLYIMLWRSRD